LEWLLNLWLRGFGLQVPASGPQPRRGEKSDLRHTCEPTFAWGGQGAQEKVRDPETFLATVLEGT
jgi:hypothetical protein